MYDYYFLDDPHRKFDDKCEFGICDNNIIYRRMRSAIDEYRRRNVEPYVGSPGSGGGDKMLGDVLEYMLYNVSGETGLPAHYSCCMYFYNETTSTCTAGGGGGGGYTQSEHVCNAIPIMIGSRLEEKIVKRLADMLEVRVSDFYDAAYLHKVYAGAFLVNGTFYYSVFRESNNNKICHNSKSKYRGDETVAYFYDKTCNRGVKVFTDRVGRLRINDRDGVELTEVTSDVMLQLYNECMHDSRHYTLDMDHIKGFFSSIKEMGSAGIDDFTNKIYTNYSIGLNTFLDKLPSSAMHNPLWNSSLMVGKINFGISQRLSYPKTKSETKKINEQKLKMCTGGMSTGYLVETQRRRNTRKNNAPGADVRRERRTDTEKRSTDAVDVSTKGRKRVKTNDSPRNGECVERASKCSTTTPPSPPPPSLSKHTILGSKDVKTTGLLEKLEQGERNGPSTFNQVSVSYLPLIRVLSSTVQKLQVEHVHAESSKTVPRDAYGFVCMKYMGNISTAGKNMLFTDRVQVAYGHVHRIVGAIELGIENVVNTPSSETVEPLVSYVGVEQDIATFDRMYVVINNAVTRWQVPARRVIEFLVFVKTKCHRYAWIRVVGRYLCVYYYEGVSLLRYERDELLFRVLERHIGGGRDGAAIALGDVESIFLSRHELEMLATMEPRDTGCDDDRYDRVDATNKLIDRWFVRCRDDGGCDTADHSSLLAKHLDQYTDYTAPAKRSVSVNARKSACANVYYQRAAELIRGFSVFVDPDAYERSTAVRAEEHHGRPRWVTLKDFARMRAEADNCPQEPRNGTDRSLANFYMLRTVFADVAGYNVEDANVLDVSVDLNLSFNYSFSLTFVDRSRSGLDIIVPPPREAASVCCWDADGNPTTVLFVVCTIRTKGNKTGAYGELRHDEIEEMLCASSDVRIVGKGKKNGGGGGSGAKTGSSGRCQRATAENDGLAFPPFRKLSVIRSEDGDYHVYYMRSDAVLLRTLRRMRSGNTAVTRRPDASNATRVGNDDYVFVCKPEVNPYDALDYMRTKVTAFDVNANERVITIDTRARGTSDKYDGVKIVNSFGQKGLALIKDLRPYFDNRQYATCDVPVQLVMNNCSFVSRQPIGQYLQMKKNMFAVVDSAAGEPTSVGYTAVFITETEPVTKSCLVRFDEMMRSVIITLGLTTFQNLKNSLDNVYNPHGLLYPPQTRQILSLYRCVGVTYRFVGDTSVPFASRTEIKQLCDIYDLYSRTPKPARTCVANTGHNDKTKALLDVLDAMGDTNKRRRLVEIGVLTSSLRPERGTDTSVLRLQGQWIEGFDGTSRLCDILRSEPDFVLHTYDSTRRVYETVHVYGEPDLVTDALDDRYAIVDRLPDRTAHTVRTEDDYAPV